MNVKAFAAIVGTLSLGALATGCASNKASEGATTETQSTQPAGDTSATGAEGSSATPTETKGEEAKCGNGSCKGSK